jgi:glycine/D-amino acid oxidase-like deaminating enzyme
MLELPAREKSYWLYSAKKQAYKKLTKDIDVDVAIIGGGISGLTTAYLLKQAGKKVVVIEKDTIASGTTGNTTGKVTSQHNLIYADLYEHSGQNDAKLYGKANETAIAQIEKLIKEEKIDCDWKRADNYVYTCDPVEVEKYKNEAKIAQKLGLPASYEIKTPLPFNTKAAVRFSNQARFNATKFCYGLASKINGNGSYIFENTRAISLHDSDIPYIRTDGGSIHAKDIVVATNVPTFPLIARGAHCVLEYPYKSYIATARVKQNINGMYISTDRNEYSILPIGNNLILIGGESHIRGAKLNKKTRYQRLADYAHQRFNASSIEYIWSAWDYQAYDDIPLVGKMYPWSRHMYVISAFRKWGLSNSMVAGTILRDTVLGNKNELAGIYDPTRIKPIKSIPRVAKQYIFG